ncbi:hypothetical protein Plhal304r1_c011g0044791 [Plasmopara halstedii]
MMLGRQTAAVTHRNRLIKTSEGYTEATGGQIYVSGIIRIFGNYDRIISNMACNLHRATPQRHT